MKQPGISFSWGRVEFTISERALMLILTFVLVLMGLPQVLPL